MEHRWQLLEKLQGATVQLRPSLTFHFQNGVSSCKMTLHIHCYSQCVSMCSGVLWWCSTLKMSGWVEFGRSLTGYRSFTDNNGLLLQKMCTYCKEILAHLIFDQSNEGGEWGNVIASRFYGNSEQTQSHVHHEVCVMPVKRKGNKILLIVAEPRISKILNVQESQKTWRL